MYECLFNFDVEIRDPVRYQDFMNQVKPALAEAGAKYLMRGGEHRVYEIRTWIVDTTTS